MATADLTVIIVNYESDKYLGRCIDAIKRQTLAPKSVVIIDNHSTDSSMEVVQKKHPELTYECLEENIGFAKANNLAIRKYVTTRWVALVNPDVELGEDWIATMDRNFQKETEYSAFASKLIQTDDKDYLDGTGDIYHISGMAWRSNHGKRLEKSPKTNQEVFSACAAAACYSVEAWHDTSGFDEDYFCYFEDVDLGFRLRLKGYKTLFLEPAIAYHKGSASTGKNSDFSIYFGHRNMIWTYFKNMPLFLLIVFLPYHILTNFLVILSYATKGKASVVVRAKYDAIKDLSKALKKRSKIQEDRRIGLFRLISTISFSPFAPYFR